MKHGSNPRRARSRGNGKRHLSPRGGQSIESNGPEVKVRGTAQQVQEKYLALARDAFSSGDRIAAEGYFQFAEHYHRMYRADHGGGGHNDRRPHRVPPAPQPDFAVVKPAGTAPAAGPDQAGPAGPGQAEPAGAAKPAEPTEPTKSAEPAESTKPAEPAEPTESTKPAEAAEPTESAEPAEPTKPTKPTEPASP
jgi:hypothetical protein